MCSKKKLDWKAQRCKDVMCLFWFRAETAMMSSFQTLRDVSTINPTWHCDVSTGLTFTPPKLNIAPEKWWLEDYFPIGKVAFQGLC